MRAAIYSVPTAHGIDPYQFVVLVQYSHHGSCKFLREHFHMQHSVNHLNQSLFAPRRMMQPSPKTGKKRDETNPKENIT